MLISISSILTYFLFSYFSVSIAYDDIVELEQGLLRGHLLLTPSNTSFRAFQGIPYAEPPLGTLRFQAPQPVKPWDGILNATEDSFVCYGVETDYPEENEDCLNLNIFTPVLNNNDSVKLPVFVWIFGGTFSHGNALYDTVGPDFLIDKDVIVVTVNFRVGPFGYLSTGDTVIPGNAGLKDHIQALKFIYANIAVFGGDPTKITLAGQSSGAASVGYQVLYQNNTGLFRAVIQQSGSPLNRRSFSDSALNRKYGFDLAQKINETVDLKNDSTALLEFLQSVNAEVIDEASTRTTIPRPLPVIEVEHEGAILTKNQYQLLESGEFIRVPTLIGTNSEEEIFEAKNLTSLNEKLVLYEENPENFFPPDFFLKNDTNVTLAANTIKDLYLKDVPEDEKMGHMVRYFSHVNYTLPVIKHADLINNYTDTYFYVFSYDGVMGNGNYTIKGADSVNHSEEDNYLFKKSSSSYSNVDLSKFPKADILTHYRLVEIWTNFVKYLNPTPNASDLLQNITWSKYTTSDRQYVDIGQNITIKTKPKSPYYELWVEYYDRWVVKPLTTF